MPGDDFLFTKNLFLEVINYPTFFCGTVSTYVCNLIPDYGNPKVYLFSKNFSDREEAKKGVVREEAKKFLKKLTIDAQQLSELK